MQDRITPINAGWKAGAVLCAARDGSLPLAVHFYNHEDDI